MSRSILNRSPLYVQIKQHILGDIRQGGAGNRAKSSRRSSILQNVSASRSEQFAAPWADLRTRASSAGEKVRARS